MLRWFSLIQLVTIAFCLRLVFNSLPKVDEDAFAADIEKLIGRLGDDDWVLGEELSCFFFKNNGNKKQKVAQHL